MQRLDSANRNTTLFPNPDTLIRSIRYYGRWDDATELVNRFADLIYRATYLTRGVGEIIMDLSFDGYNALSSSYLSSAPGTPSIPIPAKTFIRGKLKMLWPLNNSCRLSILLKQAELGPSPDCPSSAYIAVPSDLGAKSQGHLIRLNLSPRQSPSTEPLEAEYNRLLKLMRSVIQLDVSGMIFIGYEMDETKEPLRWAVLEGSGNRVLDLGGQVSMLELGE